jgi:hypothetical protein
MSVGSLLSGLSAITSGLGLVGATMVWVRSMRSASPVSWAKTMTLRTKGERDDQ